MIRALVIAMVLCGAAASGRAEPLAPLPDADAVMGAIEERPAVRAALAELEAAESRAAALRVGPHEFVLGGTWQERDVDGEGRFDEWDASLMRGVRWPGKARVDRGLADIEIERATNALADARHGEARALLSAWFAWLRADAAARRDQELVAALDRTAKAVAAQRDRGAASQMQLELAQAEAGRALAAANRGQVTVRQRLRELLTAFPELPVPGEPPAAGPPQPPSRALDEWPAVIIERSHELRLAELEMEHAQLLAQRAASDTWPDPAVGVRVLNERDGAETAVGLSVLVPLPSRHRSALADQARAESGAAVARFDAARRELEQMAAADVADARAALGAWEPMQAAAQSVAQHLRRAQRAYELGETGLAELLLSVRSATETLHEERLARLEAHEALARLAIDAHELWAPAETGHHHD